jgi:hypothetical protein
VKRASNVLQNSSTSSDILAVITDEEKILRSATSFAVPGDVGSSSYKSAHKLYTGRFAQREVKNKIKYVSMDDVKPESLPSGIELFDYLLTPAQSMALWDYKLLFSSSYFCALCGCMTDCSTFKLRTICGRKFQGLRPLYPMLLRNYTYYTHYTGCRLMI